MSLTILLLSICIFNCINIYYIITTIILPFYIFMYTILYLLCMITIKLRNKYI